MEINKSSVLITGSNRGIGYSLAEECARRGASLILVMRKKENLEPHFLKLGAISVDIYEADFQNSESVEQLLVQLKNQKIDILINNAGQLTGGLIEEQRFEDVRNMLQVNLVSLIQLTQALIPQMLKLKKGKIVNNASVSALMHLPGASTYAASKAAVWAFTNCINLELQGTGVSTLNLITPGVKTRMFDEIAVKYGKNIEVPTETITSHEYANLVCNAIENDLEELYPRGSTKIGLFVAKYFPKLFQKVVKKKFKRH